MLEIFPDYASLSRAAAERVVATAQTAVQSHGRFLVALSGGGTPEGLFRLLATPPYTTQIPWPHTHVFWSDERLVPPDDEASNFRQAHDLLLQHVPIPSNHIYRAQGELDAHDAAADYAKKLRGLAADSTWPRFDLILLGLGSDGHTASLFPGSHATTASEPVAAVSADYNGRPAARITFTPTLINRARTVIFLVSGKKKADAVKAVRDGPPDPAKWPAQAIVPSDGQILWLLDAAAAQAL